MTKKKETEQPKKHIPKLEFYEETLNLALDNRIIGGDIDYIEDLLNCIEEFYPDHLQEAVNKVKDAIQREAEKVWYVQRTWGLLAMATGTGKSKIPINILIDRYKTHRERSLKVLLVVPTEKLRDENWKDEFTKWGAIALYELWVERTCYASLKNYEGRKFDLVILDEGHNITEAKQDFFKDNTIERLIVLTATPPTDPVKQQILRSLSINAIYSVPIDIAVRLKLVAPFEITVVECRLDDITKNVVGGTKAAPFMTTEKKAYDYKSKLITQSYSMPAKVSTFRRIDRMRFIKTLESRTKNAKFILQNFIGPDERTLIFCGGIPQAEEICKQSFHSKTSDKFLNQFKNKEISWLSCLSALNEGQNIPDVETMIVVAMESSEKTITQQIGRAIRFKPGHVARVILIVYIDTMDETSYNKATVNFDKSNIRHVRMANLVAGIETI